MCLDYTWPGFKSSLGGDFFCIQVIYEDCDSLLYKALPFLRVPCGIVKTEQNRTDSNHNSILVTALLEIINIIWALDRELILNTSGSI